jgi:epoxyqueuosine reductase
VLADPESAAAYAAAVLEVGRSAGLDAVGVAPAEPFLRARACIEERRAAGLHAGMSFTFRNPVRSTTPELAVHDAKAVIAGARSYLFEEPEAPGEAAGRVARYAWTDHYAALREALWAIARKLRADGWKAVPYADDNSMVDREAAWLAGLGWFGKNANLLLPRAGSWFVLGTVVTTAPLPPTNHPMADGCGTCARCQPACPTGAIVEPGVIDGNRCLAWLLQRPGTFPVEYREALGNRLYGCDDCQEACPPTVRFGRAKPKPADAVAWVPVVELLELDDAGVLERNGRWYLADRDPRWLRRNALLVLGNTADGRDARVAAVLAAHLASPDPLIREHAAWAARRCGRHDLVREP